ncbi:MAG: VWA domain-containing protein [Deltaproteobacteria bacterium]|nr:VWA domain-containing protein [Deltaproteobacteria bacterium]MBW2445153.1 VWA domain-containing protein [Deltaproteobacteria bacterium]
MESPSRPLQLALALVLVTLLASCGSSRSIGYQDGRAYVEMEPAEAAQHALAPRVPGPPERVDLELAFPENGTIFSDSSDAYLAGQLDAPFGVPGSVDAVVVIDTSRSTSRLSGGKIDKVVRRVRGDPPDPRASETVLDAELASARLLLENVDPRNTRLGIVSFSGEGEGVAPGTLAAARTEVTLTRHLDALEAGLQRIDRRGAAGRTHMAAGLDQAVNELIGRGRSRPRDDGATQKVVVFFTDGTPTLPYTKSESNELAVITAAERAAAYGVRVFSFAVGPEALGRPVAAVEMARRTGGVFTPVKNPRDLTAAVKSIRFARFDALEIRNVTLGEGARKIHLGEDGTFDALVPLKPGKNRIFVRAQVGNVTAEAERFVHYAPGSAQPFVPDDLAARRLRLLTGEKQLEISTGLEQQRLVEVFLRDRHEAEERAARQLKELDVSAGATLPDVAAPPPQP